VTDGLIGRKRQINDVIREALDHFREDEPIAFLCECRNESCCQTVWLTAPAYDQARVEPEWLALVPGHLATEDRADAVVSSTTAALTMSATSGSPGKPATREDPHGRCND
jgi:hypothetical protein